MFFPAGLAESFFQFYVKSAGRTVIMRQEESVVVNILFRIFHTSNNVVNNFHVPLKGVGRRRKVWKNSKT